MRADEADRKFTLVLAGMGLNADFFLKDKLSSLAVLKFFVFPFFLHMMQS
jgi:hypothetical protein